MNTDIVRAIVTVITIALGLISVWLSARRIAGLRGRTDLAGRKERIETWGWLFAILYLPLFFGLSPLLGQEVAVPAAWISLIIGLGFFARARWMT